ncbi:MAG: porin family protein [Bacteroidota bacterium]
MQATDLWHKLHLHWHKGLVIGVLLCALSGQTAQAQSSVRINLPNYDEKWLHYGFLIGLHSSSYRLQYNDFFVSPAMDSVHSIVPRNLGGFKLGFISNIRLWQYLDFRALIQVGFYEFQTVYRYTDGSELTEFRDATIVEFPLLLKYKSVRRGNIGMYLIGGINPAFEASAQGEDEEEREKLQTRNFNLSLEAGVGFDLFFPLFKFSPELRYSFGLMNALEPEINSFNAGLQRLSPHNIGIFITFEGGPS